MSLISLFQNLIFIPPDTFGWRRSSETGKVEVLTKGIQSTIGLEVCLSRVLLGLNRDVIVLQHELDEDSITFGTLFSSLFLLSSKRNPAKWIVLEGSWSVILE